MMQANGYGWPGDGNDPCELDSFVYHAENYFKPSVEAEKPGQEKIDWMLDRLEEAYKKCVWRLRNDYLSKEAFVDAVYRLDWTSSPGLPYLYEAPTNGDWLGHNGVYCKQERLDELWHDVQQLIDGSQREIKLRVFIKQEPHKIEKIQTGRWRLILASPLNVQVFWNMLFSTLNDIEIEKSLECPSQQGIVLVNGGWKDYVRQWKNRGYNCGLDKSAWDWTCPWWALKTDLQLRYRLGRGSRMEEWLEHAERQYGMMFCNPLLVFTDGAMWQQNVPGFMKSGCIQTISTNSHCQVMMHFLVSYDLRIPVEPVCVAVGDDTLQSDRHADPSAYRRYGVVVKSASEGLEFVGHEFTDEGPHPLYMSKHVCKLRYVKDENLEDYLQQMLRMYVHTRYYYVWEYLAERLGYEVPFSRQYLLRWYDNPETAC